MRKELELGDWWQQQSEFDNFLHAKTDYEYLSKSSRMREYRLARIGPPDPLNDALPI